MTNNYNPLILLAKKTLVGEGEASAIELIVLLHFDAAKRGLCTNAGSNFLCTHLIIASYMAARLKSQRFHNQVVRAWAMLGKATARPTETLTLTTGEYLALREAFKTYFYNLPNAEVGLMADACMAAQERMA